MTKTPPIIEIEHFYSKQAYDGRQFFHAVMRIDLPNKQPVRFRISGPDMASVRRKAVFLSISGHVPDLSQTEPAQTYY